MSTDHQLETALVNLLRRDGSFTVDGLGTFELRSYHAYEGRHPRTGQGCLVSAQTLPFLRVAPALRECLQLENPVAAVHRLPLRASELERALGALGVDADAARRRVREYFVAPLCALAASSAAGSTALLGNLAVLRLRIDARPGRDMRVFTMIPLDRFKRLASGAAERPVLASQELDVLIRRYMPGRMSADRLRSWLDATGLPRLPDAPQALAKLERLLGRTYPEPWKTLVQHQAPFAGLPLLEAGRFRDALASLARWREDEETQEPPLGDTDDLVPIFFEENVYAFSLAHPERLYRFGENKVLFQSAAWITERLLGLQLQRLLQGPPECALDGPGAARVLEAQAELLAQGAESRPLEV